ncbi:aminopeptidase [uncultured Sphaerochaeta sp.]|uniref:aminopeptidase n=1 Tax=uncultured Sphaerochaeta sp. TaxID=886478 RepID=UPI002A0A1957|nr:aminopeptidase [uncultured Sphaerochaeta sp.]
MDNKVFFSDYKDFLISSKTERLCTKEIINRLEASGFKPMDSFKNFSAGSRFYKVVKGRTVLAGVVGTHPERLRIIGSHVDSPKLDLKPQPFFEKGKLALVSLHDYGMIKPYQWVTTPLELQGIIMLKNGTEVQLSIGENEGEPLFSISDIPPHIASAQMKQPMSEGFNVAQLNAVVGCLDKSCSQDNAINKVNSLLKEKYGIEPGDFTCADLCLVPHNAPVDIGFDSSLIGAYGHDDRVCVYTSLMALLRCEVNEKTSICFFVDKEEVASTGDTSAQSFVLRNFIRAYVRHLDPSETGTKDCYDADDLLEQAQAISADVTTAFDPNFPEKFDEVNSAFLGSGVVVEKYGAAGSGKFRSNEASAEFMQTIRSIILKESIAWQVGTLARLGIGGGGTIAQFLSRYGMDCVDAGPCLLSMHSPLEICSKYDIYETYRLYYGFFIG